jgi:hypothetical protein
MLKRSGAIGLAIAVLVLVAACEGGSASPDGGSASPPGSTLPPGSFPSSIDQGRFFAIEEIGIGSDGWVTLHNYTDQTANVGGLFLCQEGRCVELQPAEVPPDGLARIANGGGSGLEDVAMTNAGLTLEPVEGEVALFSSDDTDDPTAIRSFLEWGSTPHSLTETAIEAGIWLEGSYAPTGPNSVRLYRENSLWLWEMGEGR